ncbi:hypothetical protein GC197_00115 [bacterium]|nr:hypothetical protein [bacterium]
MSVYFAYDGSVAGDWVAHYAVRMASSQVTPRLTVLYVEPNRGSHVELVQDKVKRIAYECQQADVEFEFRIEKIHRSISETILDLVPPGMDSLVVVGPRHLQRRSCFLKGSVAEQLLLSGHCHVIYFQVNTPELPGSPEAIVLPLIAEPDELVPLPTISYFTPSLRQLNVLLLERHPARTLSNWFGASTELHKHDWEAKAHEIETELSLLSRLDPHDIDVIHFETAHPARNILLAASRMNSQLILMDHSWITHGRCMGQPDVVDEVLHDATCDVAISRTID